MGQNSPQAMGKDVLGTFMPHPGVIPGPGGSENGWFFGSKTAKMTGCHIEQKNLPGNWIMLQSTPQPMGKDVLGAFMTDHIALYFKIINTELTWISSFQPMFQYPYEDYFSCPRDEHPDVLCKTILDFQDMPRPKSELLYNGHMLRPVVPRLHKSLLVHFRKHKKTHVVDSLASTPVGWPLGEGGALACTSEQQPLVELFSYAKEWKWATISRPPTANIGFYSNQEVRWDEFHPRPRPED